MDETLKPLKWYRSLSDGKGRQQAQAFIVEGSRAIRQIISTHGDEILEILTVGEPPLEYSSYPLRQITQTQMQYVSNNQTPPGALAVVKMPLAVYSTSLSEKPGDKILLLEDIQDPGNVGTLIRTAAAFGFSGVILTDKCADPFSPKCVQSSAGTVLSIWLRRTAGYLEIAEHLKRDAYFLVEADLRGEEDVSILKTREKMILALGNEGAGLSARLLAMADFLLRIPIDSSSAESLNVAACGAICMYISSKRSG